MRAQIPLFSVVAALALATAAQPRPQAAAPPPPPDRGGAAAVPAGEKDLRMQVLLDRAHCSVGEIDGNAGSNTSRAVAAYEQQRVGGAPVVHAAWHALSTDNAPTLVDYTITAEGVKGPFVKVPQDMMAKSRLKALDYSSVAEKLGEKFHSSPALLRKLNPGKPLAAGETIRVPNVRTDVPGKAARVVVDRSDGSVSALDAQGNVLARYPATMGSE